MAVEARLITGATMLLQTVVPGQCPFISRSAVLFFQKAGE